MRLQDNEFSEDARGGENNNFQMHRAILHCVARRGVNSKNSKVAFPISVILFSCGLVGPKRIEADVTAAPASDAGWWRLLRRSRYIVRERAIYRLMHSAPSE
jgi:hypothetical protein